MNVKADIQLIDGGALKVSFEISPGALKGLLDNLKNGGTKKKKVITEAPDLEEKRKRFYLEVKKFQDANPDKHPFPLYVEFNRYWGEASKSGKSIRYDDEKFFDIGRRLLTFRNRVHPDKLGKMWEQHNNRKAGDRSGKTLFDNNGTN